MFPPNEPIYILNKTIDKYLNNVIISSITYLLSCILVLLTLESNLYNNSPDIFCGDLMNQINQILVLFSPNEPNDPNETNEPNEPN